MQETSHSGGLQRKAGGEQRERDNSGCILGMGLMGVHRYPDVEGTGKGAVRGAPLLLAWTARVASVEGP